MRLNNPPPNSARESETLVDLLQWRARYQSDETAYVFLTNGEDEEDRLTYEQLDTWARAIAGQLQHLNLRDERALLLFPAGLDYIAAFFGCLYAGVTAVPVYPPHPAKLERSLPRIRVMVEDAQPRIALMPATIQPMLEQMFSRIPNFERLTCLATDTLDQQLAAEWRDPLVRGDTLAFLQYTSGSTAAPRGVMVSHSNLIHNHQVIQSALQHPPDAPYLSWLPLFHDMGLIGNALQAVYTGVPCVLMSPTSFLQRPIRWLRAISRYKAATSGGPNFAYELCVRQTTAEQRAGLDLSHWKIAFNGAEPVRADTIERFTAAFKPYGFRPEALYPCYGLAESTLFVTGRPDDAGPGMGVFQSASLDQRVVVPSMEEDSHSRRLVHCGHPWLDHTVAIVDPETRRRCMPDQVGEIWVRGPSVAQGYWGYPEKSEQTFRAHLVDTGEGPFLRTGDLGFMYEGNLFVAGRHKDMIIIRGRNHYPQDIETTVERSHPALRAGGGAACSVEVAGEERLLIVQEVERHAIRKLDIDAVSAQVRRAVAEEHEVDVYAVVLLKTGSIPKTSSGKIQRHACRVGFLQGTLSVVGQWQQQTGSPAGDRAVRPADVYSPTPTKGVTVEAIQIWLANEIASLRHIAPQDIDIWQPFASYGLTSAELVSLSGKLEEWLDRQLSPTLLYDYPTIGALAAHLTQISGPTKRTSGERLAEAEAIAIVGIGCRFPGADSPAAFWKLLLSGGDAVTEVPAQRWNVDDFYEAAEARPGKMNTRWGAFLADVDQFDAGFFGLAPREAEQMDPQQRLLLDVSWEALEHAGIAPSRLAGQPVGVFIGVSNNDYARLPSDPLSADVAYAGTGNALSIAANRLSYVLDLRGPALAVDTACSSSLVAVHLACESLRRGESELALVGGVNLILTPDVSVTLSQAQMLSPDGRCKTFDAQANGYVRGEGCGMIVLKPLSAALRDGDAILAQIKGSAVNQDGRSNGLTAPSGLAQQAVIRQALDGAGVEPAQVSYVEAHGSGTSLGDPIEINALKAVLMQERDLADRCWIGSVKTNIGHLEAAAGIAGLIKTVLALHHGVIPPHLHLTTLNPHITLDDTSFEIPTSATPWSGAQRLAGVSAFGFGGTNAHVVLETAPEQPPSETCQRPLQILTLSARNDQALATLVGRYHDFLVAHPETSLADLCFTASTGRAHFSQRLALSAGSVDQAREQLAAFSAGESTETVLVGRAGRKPPEIVFLFTGQGAQYVGMGRTLYETAPVFRQALDECDSILRPYLPLPLLSVIYPAAEQATPLDETAYTQPALFAVEYALARLWQSWGVTPTALLGHSVGEYVAACIAGVFSLEDGLRLVAERARLMQMLPQDGRMAAVFAAEADVAAVIAPYADIVAIAAVNGPKHCVISGSTQAIEAISDSLRRQAVEVTPLKVSHAFHSPLMQPMLNTFAQVAESVRYGMPQIPIISNVTGAVVSAEMSTAGYWVEHVRQPVRFAAGMGTLHTLGYRVFLEVGPHPVLISMGRQSLEEDSIVWLPSLRRKTEDWRQILHSLGSLYTHGLEINWLGFEQHARRRLRLPTYPWQRQRYWREPGPATDLTRPQPRATNGSTAAARHPLLGLPLPSLAHEPDTYVWELDLAGSRPAYFDDHQIGGTTVVPVSAYIEMALGAAAEVFGTHACRLSDLALHHPLFLSRTHPGTLQVSMTQDKAGRANFRVYGLSAHTGTGRKQWILHATAMLHPVTEPFAIPA